MTKQPDKKN